MLAAERQLLPGQMPAPQRRDTLSACLTKSIQQSFERPAREAPGLRESVEWLERLRFPLGEDDLRSRDPVGFFAVNQVADHVLRAPRVGTLVCARPRSGEPAQHALERARRAVLDFERGGECEIHTGAPPWWRG